MLNDEMKLFVLFCVFLLGAYITSATPTSAKLLRREVGGTEGFIGGAESNNVDAPRCPNMLIQKGTSLFLYNTKLAPVPGVNPIRFENLEDYVEFMEWMRGQGIKCPILYLQHSLNTQGESIYSIRPGPTDLQGGLPPNIATAPQLFGGGSGSSNSNDDASTMFSPEQISEITRIIDQSGDNDPYNASTYPGGWSNTIIKPADKASLMKIQSSYTSSGSSGSSGENVGMKLDGYPGMAAAATAAATARYGGREYDNSRDNEYTNDHYKVFDSYNLSDPNSYFNQLANSRKRQDTEKEARLQKIKEDATRAAAAATA